MQIYRSDRDDHHGLCSSCSRLASLRKQRLPSVRLSSLACLCTPDEAQIVRRGENVSRRRKSGFLTSRNCEVNLGERTMQGVHQNQY